MKDHSRALSVFVSAIVLCVALVSAATAQEITGSIVGTVKDANGAAVKGATVTIIDSDKKAVAQVEICFQCLQHARPEGVALLIDWCALAELCRDLKLPNSPGPDFCKLFNRMKSP